MHRDLTPENILLNNGQVKIGDFGIAVDFTSGLTTLVVEPELFLSPNGNPRYRAPEVKAGSLYSLAAEVYNFGSVLFELFGGAKPLAEISNAEIAAAIQNGVKPVLDSDALHPGVCNLIERCWSADPSARPAFAQIPQLLADLKGSGP